MISNSHITVTYHVLLWESRACRFQGSSPPLNGSIGCRWTFAWWLSCWCRRDPVSFRSDTFSSGTRSWSGVSGQTRTPDPWRRSLYLCPENITGSVQITRSPPHQDLPQSIVLPSCRCLCEAWCRIWGPARIQWCSTAVKPPQAYFETLSAWCEEPLVSLRE